MANDGTGEVVRTIRSQLRADTAVANPSAYIRAFAAALNDRFPDAEKSTPETEWRRLRDIWGALGLLGKALTALVRKLEQQGVVSETVEEFFGGERPPGTNQYDPLIGQDTGAGAGSVPGSPGVPGGIPAGMRLIRLGVSKARLAAEEALDALDGYIPESLLDAKGDLIAASAADTPVRVAVGTDGKVLTADSAAAAGVSWQTPASGGGDVENPMTSDLDAGGFKITNYGTPSAAGDVTDKAYVDAADLLSILVDGTRAFTGDQSMGSHKLTNVTNPSSAQDAATKSYVDTADALAILKSLVDAKGDLLVGTASDTVARLAVGTNVRALVADSSATEGVAWGGGVDNFVFASTSTFDLRFDGTHTQAALTTFTPTADRLYAYPVWIKRPCVIDRLGYEVTTAGAGGGKVRLGIYKANSSTDPKPGTLIVDSGEFSGADVETTGMKEKTISQSILEPGLYWFAFDVNTTAGGSFVVRAIAAASTLPILGMDAAGGNRNTGLLRTYSFAALPDPFAGTLSTRSGAMPQVYVRYSSAS